MKRGFLTSSPKTRRSSEMARVNTSSLTNVSGQTAPHQAFLGHDLIAVLGQAHADLHHLGLEAHRAGGSRSRCGATVRRGTRQCRKLSGNARSCGFGLAAFYRSGLRSLSAAPLAAPRGKH